LHQGLLLIDLFEKGQAKNQPLRKVEPKQPFLKVVRVLHNFFEKLFYLTNKWLIFL
jgi:hypothetical protein